MGCDSDQVVTLDWGGQARSLKRWHSIYILNYKKQLDGMSVTQCLVEEQKIEAKYRLCDLVPWKLLGRTIDV